MWHVFELELCLSDVYAAWWLLRARVLVAAGPAVVCAAVLVWEADKRAVVEVASECAFLICPSLSDSRAQQMKSNNHSMLLPCYNIVFRPHSYVRIYRPGVCVSSSACNVKHSLKHERPNLVRQLIGSIKWILSVLV